MCNSVSLAIKTLLFPFVCHCDLSQSISFLFSGWKGCISPKCSQSRWHIAFYFYRCVFLCFSRVFLCLGLHVYLLQPLLNNTSGRNTHIDIRDCWLVTVIPSRHFWCKWGEIKGYHPSVYALRTISFPAVCTTSIFKAGFLSIRLHEYSYFPLEWNMICLVFCFLELQY